MASYQDLFDAIARVRAATGDPDSWRSGLSGEDIAAVCNPLSSPGVLGAVLAKVIAAHPDAFVTTKAASPPPRVNEGVAADAIRDAEAALAQQHSATAQLDLQVVTAVLNAHAAHERGLAELDRLQREIEAAVLARSDLDTPAGAREFQRFLIGKLRDIRTVVDTADLDATSKAALAAALASLYASSTPEPLDQGGPQPLPDSPPPPVQPRPLAAQREPPVESEPLGLAAVPESMGVQPSLDLPPLGIADLPPEPALLPSAPISVMPAPAPAPAPPPQMSAPAMPPAPAWGGGVPAPFGGGLPPPSPPDLPAVGSSGRWLHDSPAEVRDRRPDPPPSAADTADEERASAAAADEQAPAVEDVPADATTVELPDGQRVSAPSPEVAAAITAALGGVPIPDAFRQQGMTLPAPGTPVAAPVDPASLAAGDIGVLADRHALALGNGEALLDRQIQPIASVSGPGFLGWVHPPVPATASPETNPETPDVPAPQRPVQTAPS